MTLEASAEAIREHEAVSGTTSHGEARRPLTGLPRGFRILLPGPEELARRWREIEPLFVRALARGLGTHEPVDFLAQTLAGQAAIWIVEADAWPLAAVCTQIRIFPRRRGYEILAAGGSGMGLWLRELTARIEAHARSLHCDFVFGSGRVGWERAVRASGGGKVMWRML